MKFPFKFIELRYTDRDEFHAIEGRQPTHALFYLKKGSFRIEINGKKEIQAIDIKPDIVDPDDIETLSDVLVAAVNEAIKKVEDTNAAEMQKVTGNVSIPGLF